MARWRDTKQGRTPKPKKTSKKSKESETKLHCAGVLDKIKAFLTDTFMLAMPVMYIVIYLVMGSLKDAGTDKVVTWSYILIALGIIVVSFYIISGQTPGLKAYDLKVVDINTKQKPSIILAILRYFFFTIVVFSVIGLIVPLFRKDRRGLHDLLSGTAIVKLTEK